jgi:TRAP-type C4-dicarboxylate transport system substrate-binding protein
MRSLIICGILVFALVLVGPLVPEGSAQQKVITLNYSNYHAAMNPNSKIAEDWSHEVEKRTSGRVKISYFPGGTLTPSTQTYDSVVRGIADIGFSITSFTKGKFPMLEVVDLPLGYKSGYQAGMMVNALYKKFKPKEFDDTKVMYLQSTAPMRLFMKSKPVNKMEDLKGARIRATGNSARFVELLGGAPVGLPITDTYDAVSRGVVDGMLVGFEPLKPFKLAEVVKFGTVFQNTYATAGFVVMNKKKWESISPQDQKIIETINEEYADKHARLWDTLDQDGKDFFLQLGGKINTLSPEEDARWLKTVSPMFDEYVKSMKAKSIPGDEVIKFCLDYVKATK